MNISSKQEDIDIDNLIGVVVRQTTCSTEEAEKMLQQKQFDVMSTIKSLLNINEKKKDKKPRAPGSVQSAECPEFQGSKPNRSGIESRRAPHTTVSSLL